jgi:hypothetical protein
LGLLPTRLFPDTLPPGSILGLCPQPQPNGGLDALRIGQTLQTPTQLPASVVREPQLRRKPARQMAHDPAGHAAQIIDVQNDWLPDGALPCTSQRNPGGGDVDDEAGPLRAVGKQAPREKIQWHPLATAMAAVLSTRRGDIVTTTMVVLPGCPNRSAHGRLRLPTLVGVHGKSKLIINAGVYLPCCATTGRTPAHGANPMDPLASRLLRSRKVSNHREMAIPHLDMVVPRRGLRWRMPLTVDFVAIFVAPLGICLSGALSSGK